MAAVLFTDLVGSTELLSRLGEAAFDGLRRAHFAALREAIGRSGGAEVKTTGDGLLATFSSAADAVVCAVAMQQAVDVHRRTAGIPLDVRVGVSVGDVVFEEGDVFGTPVVEAARLVAIARGGQILTSAVVRVVAGGRSTASFTDVGPVELKGLPALVPACEVAWEPVPLPRHRRRRREPPPPRPAACPLVGRSEEMSRFEGALTHAAAGNGRILFLVGGMGLGKTRLAEEGLALARQRGFSVLVGRTPAAGSGLAYAPLLGAFGSVLRKLEAWDRDALIRDLPHLGRLWPDLGLPPPAPLQDADLERTLLFEAAARLLERLAAQAPVAFFVDDLHWADAPSLAWLAYLVPRLHELPAVLVGAYRPEGIAENRALRHLVSMAMRSWRAEEVPLRALNVDEVATLAAVILGDKPPASLLDLSAQAAGTPLFVEALVGGLRESGALVRSDAGWTLIIERSTLPRSVRDLVADRLDMLSSAERRVIELIAHGSQGLPHDILEHTAGGGPNELLALISRLLAVGLLLQEEEGSDIVYRLSHPLFQEVAAGELPAVASRRFHAQLARTVDCLHPGDLDRLAYHYSRAGGEVDTGRAIDVFLEAGERADSLAAHDEAARHFGAALPLIRDGHRPELLAHVLERLGESWEPIGELAAAREVWTEALAELGRTGDSLGVARLQRRLGMAARTLGDIDAARHHLVAGIEALGDSPPSQELADLYGARLLVEDSPLSDPDGAEPAIRDLARLAERLGSPRAATEALLAEVAMWWGRSRYDLARIRAEEAVRVAESAGEWLLADRAYRELAWVAFHVADRQLMTRAAEASLELNRRLGSPVGVIVPTIQLALTALFGGDLEEGTRLADEAVARARRYDLRRHLAMSLGILAVHRVWRGELEMATATVADAHRALPDIAADTRGPVYLVGWAEVLLAFERGDAREVLTAATGLRFPLVQLVVGMAQVLSGDLCAASATAEVLAVEGEAGSFPAALADRLMGLVEQARGNAEVARGHLTASADALTALDLPLEAAVSRLYVGTIDSIREALAAFEGHGARRYAEKAKKVLRGLGVRLSSPRTGRDLNCPLSRREHEVARLVTEGLTNVEIAERLVLSVRTVESHLEHVYARLGISSRAALAAWVATSDRGTPAS